MQSFFLIQTLSYLASNIQIFKYILNYLATGSRFTLFPIHSEDKSGFDMKGSDL